MVGESKPNSSQMQTSCQLPELVFEIRAIWPSSKGKNHIENVITIKKKKKKIQVHVNKWND